MNSANRFGRRESASVDTRVSTYDRFSAMLVATLAIGGMLVLVLFGIWMMLDEHRQFVRNGTGITIGPDIEDGHDVAAEWDEPASGDLPEADSPDLQDMLHAVSHLPSRVLGAIALVEGGTGVGTLGDGQGRRDRGPAPEPSAPADFERWQITYSSVNRQEYFELLDHFDIYLAAVSQLSNRIEFLQDVSEPGSQMVIGDRQSELAETLWFRNTKRKVREWDERRMRNAGCELTNKLVVQFYPDTMCEQLSRLEREACESLGKPVDQIRKTSFVCEKDGDEFRLSVKSIEFRD